MRKLLIIVLFIIVAVLILWLWRGRDLSMLVDQLALIEASSRPIKTISYEGSGTGGILHVDDFDFSLNDVQLGGAQPSVGTTKDGQLALSFHEKVFPFGPAQAENLSTTISAGDVATISVQHSALSWPNFFEINFMTGKSPTWKRQIYQKLAWKKSTGASLEMLWRYEQYFYPRDGWLNGLMTREGSTGLIRVEISDTSR